MKNRTLRQSFKNAFSGLTYAFIREKNVKIHTVFTVVVVLFGVFFKIEALEWLALIITIALVIVCELINTSIEAVVDMITKEYNEKAKIAKDIAAAAVLFSAIISTIVGIIVFGDNIIQILINANVLK